MNEESFKMKKLDAPNDKYSIFVTSDQVKWWAQENFDDYESGLKRYNEMLQITKELDWDEPVEQQIHFVKIVTRYEEILSEVMMIGEQ